MSHTIKSLDTYFQKELSAINNYLENALENRFPYQGFQNLKDSMSYSLNQQGGKRFRPLLSVLTAQLFSKTIEFILPFACAVEMIHTYSLIHDDLPSMDNDDFRRGQPTNHKVYGEALAILAGDALQTEAFHQIAKNYTHFPEAALAAIKSLSMASGYMGMVGGQAIDIGLLKKENQSPEIQELFDMHALKTGALISASVTGAAELCGANDEEYLFLKKFSESLGFAFQLADDILDDKEREGETQELSGFPKHFGLSATHEKLRKHSQICLETLSNFSNKMRVQKSKDTSPLDKIEKNMTTEASVQSKTDALKSIVLFNLERVPTP